MPTPVSLARQCLTQEASHALDEAVAVARRRSHSQTTSVHVISAFLSLPSSSLRDACARVRSSAYAPRFQFKALELSFGSALDRLPSSQSHDEPPISNSLMAAIKRSQANQRRNPESFHLYQQQLQQQNSQQQQNPLNCVKVELQQLILSILDDPIVSRVFGEAGFRSCDIKLAILRPLPPLGRFQRSRRAPLFLCNLPGGDSELSGTRNFNFPFLGCSGELGDGDESFRRIGEVLGRKKERNPLLVGASANEALHGFSEIIERGKVGLLPAEISGLNLFSIEKEISNFICESGNEKAFLGPKFEELDQLIGSCCGPGVLLSFGDLKVLLEDSSVDAVSYVVSQLSRLLELHHGKCWLMGAVATYELYLKFLMRFPSIEKDWDLQLLPITSLKPHPGGFQSRPQSLMESFVPFGGFFSSSDLKGPINTANEPVSRCHLCNEKCEQEISAFLNGGLIPSVADQYNASLPSWLQEGELNTNNVIDMTKANDGGSVFNAKVTGLQSKWNDICRRLHHCSSISQVTDHQVSPQRFQASAGFSLLSERKADANNFRNSSDTNSVSNENGFGSLQPSMSIGLQTLFSPTSKSPNHVVSEAENVNSACKLPAHVSHTECSPTESLPSPPHPLSSSSTPQRPLSGSSTPHEESASAAVPVTTDLGLGTLYASSYEEPKKLTVEVTKGWLQKSSQRSPRMDNVVKPKSPSCSHSNFNEQVDPNDLKSLWRCLMDKVGRQNEAIHAISQTIVHCRTGNDRRRGVNLKRDIWFSFMGPDRVAKRRTALALAEILFGSRQNVITVDLNSQEGSTHSNTIFGCKEINGYDVKFRGKMVVDYIAEEISRKPLSVVYLENINKSDMLLQNSLSRAIKTGKFSDSRGREISINNTLFIATSSVNKDTKSPSFEKICTKFSEERILAAQSLEMRILVDSVHQDSTKSTSDSIAFVTSRKVSPGPSVAKKRKLIENSDITEHDWLEQAHKSTKCLDLNLPVEDTEAIDSECDTNESDTISENTETWLEEFLEQMDGTAVFKPFDFDALANRLLKEISVVLKNTIGSGCVLEIDSKVMEQILAAAWLSDKKQAVEDWVEQILGKTLAEAQQRYAFTGQSLLKLVTCDELYVREQASDVCLPSRIILD